jgi:hypothetical protein
VVRKDLGDDGKALEHTGAEVTTVGAEVERG